MSKGEGYTIDCMSFETHLNYLKGLLEALNELTVNQAVVDRPSLYDAADATLDAIELHFEALERKFKEAFYERKGFDPNIWPALPHERKVVRS